MSHVEMIVKTHFHAAHRLPNYRGVCQRLHGHTYKVEARLSGNVDEETGMLIDFTLVKKVLRKYDHENINHPDDVGLPSMENPTAENLARMFASDLLNLSDRIREVKITLWETDDCAIHAEAFK